MKNKHHVILAINKKYYLERRSFKNAIFKLKSKQDWSLRHIAQLF
jgi:hypothetical protein